jgi:hypothetical protein
MITIHSNLLMKSSFHRLNDLHRELHRHNIRDSVIHFLFINDRDATKTVPGNYYDKIQVFQDNAKDRLGKKLRNRGQTTGNYVFGR